MNRLTETALTAIAGGVAALAAERAIRTYRTQRACLDELGRHDGLIGVERLAYLEEVRERHRPAIEAERARRHEAIRRQLREEQDREN